MNVEIAERLAARRKLAGLSQEALAEKLGVSRQAVSKWERSESSPDTDNLIALAKLYGVSLDELLYVDESIEDDVAFEAADRARTQKGAGATRAAAVGASAPSEPDAPSSDGSASAADGEADGAESSDVGDVSAAEDGLNFEKEGKGNVHIGFDGIDVADGKDHVHVSWADGVHVVDRHGEEVHVGWDGVRVNTQKPGAANHVFTREHGWDSVNRDFLRKWNKFPFWAIMLVAYLVLGMLSKTTWTSGLILLALIPLYYLIGGVVASRRIVPFLCALYPLGAVIWFIWIVFIDGNWYGPAWVIFLTIPLVEVLIVKTAEWWRSRSSASEKIEVEVEEAVPSAEGEAPRDADETAEGGAPSL
ncbi:helix-turn-helix domain-containing protein [Adlercreutzia equolifaciens]|uniref:helix-turn-helix domain-containing protein n=1 Tax=Adlercreutzia equolifaciens TaxID=446660 RepID=UPI0023B0DC8B|nr:helix-turn-helix domain-containing protein [Adlercreutzia equolifaciens]MDE8701709.1 helix-turn-helix domain-containing protein [Adlercreutzia equolifaciens]